MASSFPGGLDSFTNPTATDTLDSATVPHADQHSNANDAIEAIESTLGVNPQGGSATVVARLTALDSTVAGKAPASGISPSAITGTAVVTSDARLSDTRIPTDASVTDAKIATTLSPSKITGTAVVTSDSRLTDARTPTSHASTHGVAGSDPVTVASSQVTGLATSATTDTTNADNITSGTLAAARVATLNQNTTGNAATATTAGTLSSALSTTLGGTGVTTGLTVLDGGNLTASTVTNAKLVNSSVTVNGSAISLGGSATVTAVPSGSAGGDLTGTFPNPTLATAGTAGTYTKVTTDTKGRVTSGTTLSASDIPTIAATQVTDTAYTIAQKKAEEYRLASSLDVYPRLFTTAGRTLTNATVWITMFTPSETITVSNISTFCTAGGTDSGGTTVRRMGLFTCSGTNNTTLTLVARTASDTTLWNTTSTAYTRALSTTGGYPSTYTLNAGTTYAFGCIAYNTGGTFNIPTIASGATNAYAFTPYIVLGLAGQTDLPTAATTFSAAFAAPIFGRLT